LKNNENTKIQGEKTTHCGKQSRRSGGPARYQRTTALAQVKPEPKAAIATS